MEQVETHLLEDTRTNDQHNFRASPSTQAKELLEARAFVAGHGDSYIAVTTP